MQFSSPHKPITSKENNTIKYLRSLSNPKIRRKEGAFLIEGTKMVEEALRDRLDVLLVAASPDLIRHRSRGILKLAESRSIDVHWISGRLMDTIAESKTPQPAMAVAKIKEYSIDRLLDDKAGLIVIAHELQDPGNLGTIIRTAEAVGASGVACSSNTVDPFSPKTVRASMGSILRLPIVHIGNGAAFLETCKQRGFQTLAAVITGEKTHFDVDLKKPTALLLGQEGAGLPHNFIADIDVRVRIPLSPAIDSLNVATAAAVILYEALRQRFYQ